MAVWTDVEWGRREAGNETTFDSVFLVERRRVCRKRSRLSYCNIKDINMMRKILFLLWETKSPKPFLKNIHIVLCGLIYFTIIKFDIISY